MDNMNRFGTLDWIATLLVIIGGLNWGLIGLFDYDLVSAIFGTMTTVSRTIFSLVGLSAVYLAVISTTKLTAK
jgi:uncharacterized protein